MTEPGRVESRGVRGSTPSSRIGAAVRAPAALIEAKLRPPPGPLRPVARPRLVPTYLRTSVVPLTVIAGPAGCGKTVAARQCVEAAGLPTAWVSLDADDDERRLWQYAVEALRRALPPLDLEELADPGDTPAFLGELLNALDRVAEPVVLVLHDLHLVDGGAPYGDLAFLVDHAPATLHLVVVTRATPPWPLARWRVGGDLEEIGEDELRFRDTEAGELLAAEGLQLRDDERELLVQRTEGWAAGLRLAALSIGAHDDRAEAVRRFGGEDRMVVEYFESEVLDRESPEVRELLLSTAVLDRFDLELCRAVSGRPDADALLQHLVDANLFVVPLDPRREWFRYHRLFAAALRHELELHTPERVAGLHRAAAACHTRHGDAELAVRHLVASGARDEAFELVVSERDDEAEPEAWRGGWLDRFPPGYVAEDAGRMLDLAAALVADGRFEESELWLERAGRALERAGAQQDRRAHLLALSAVCRAGRGDARRAVEEGLAALDAAGDRIEGDPVLERLPVHLARSLLLLDDLPGAERMCERLTSTGVSDSVSMLLRPGVCARIAARSGDLRRAEALAQRVLVGADKLGTPNHSSTLDARLASATVELDRDRLTAAEAELDRVRALARQRNAIPYAVLALLEHARVTAARAGAGEGLSSLAAARRLEELARGQALARRIDALEARLCIDSGDLGRAAALLRYLSTGPGRTLLEARFDLASGFPDVARSRIAATSFATRREQVVATLLTARALIGTDRAAAERHLARALDLGGPEGFVRPFLEEGRDVAAALRGVTRSAPAPLPGRLVAALAGRSGPSRREGPDEPFSERERSVLRYLPSRLTNQEIAGELFISLNTLKTHLKSIYRKLDAGSRAEAVAAARRAGLL